MAPWPCYAGFEKEILDMVTVKWLTKGRGMDLDADRRQVTKTVRWMYGKALSETGISRKIVLYICDEFMWKKMKMRARSVAHHNTRVIVDACIPHEAIFLRETTLMWPDAQEALPKILRHELVHASLGKRETKSHGALFRKTAKKHGAAQIGDY